MGTKLKTKHLPYSYHLLGVDAFLSPSQYVKH